MRGFSTFEQAVDVRLVRHQGSLVRVYRRKGTMDDGQPTLLNRRASPFDRVLKTEIFRRGELSLFLATARARRASAKFSLLSSFLFSFLSFFYFLLRNARVWRTFRERERGRKRRKRGEGKKEKGKTGERCISGVTDQLQIQSDSRLDIPQLFSLSLADSRN